MDIIQGRYYMKWEIYVFKENSNELERRGTSSVREVSENEHRIAISGRESDFNCDTQSLKNFKERLTRVNADAWAKI